MAIGSSDGRRGEGTFVAVTARILVVDDDPAIRSVVMSALQDEGYLAEEARDGETAIAAVVRDRPAVVFLDMHLAQSDGRSFVAELRRREIDVPIVLMTASSRGEARRWMDDIAAAAYLAKPFDLNDLFALARQFCPSPSTT